MSLSLEHVRDALLQNEPPYSELAANGPALLPYLKALAEEAEPSLVARAVYTAGLLDYPESLAILQSAAAHRDPIVRVAVAAAAAGLASQSIVDVIGSLLTDSDVGVRKWSLKTVEEVQPPGLAAKVQEALRNETNPTLRQMAGTTLARLPLEITSLDVNNVTEGTPARLTVAFVSPMSSGHEVRVSWGDGAVDSVLLDTGTFQSTHQHMYGDDGVYRILVTVRATPSGESNQKEATISVNNFTPIISIGSNAEIDEGSRLTRACSFADPGHDTWTGSVDYGDGGGERPLNLTPDKTFQLDHFYQDNGLYTVVAKIADDDGGVSLGSFQLTVRNVPPKVDAGADISLEEGNTLVRGGSFADPGADTWTGMVDYGDGSGQRALAISPDKTFHLEHGYLDDGTFIVTVNIVDDDGGIGAASFRVTVTNVPPKVRAGSGAMLYSGQTYRLAARFDDPGVMDQFRSDINWDDGNTGPGLMGFAAGHGSVDADHRYFEPRSYKVQVSVIDDDGGAGSDAVTINVRRVPMSIDLKPGSADNRVNPKAEGVVPVALSSTEAGENGLPLAFDVSEVDLATLRFGTAVRLEAGGGTAPAKSNGVNRDPTGHTSLLLHFPVADAGLDSGTAEIRVWGRTTKGVYFEGISPVEVVPKGQ